MMMAAVRKIVARVGDTHVPQTETTPESTFNHCAVLRPNEIQNRILWSGLALGMGSARHNRQRHREHDKPGDLHGRSPLASFKETVRPAFRVSDIEGAGRS